MKRVIKILGVRGGIPILNVCCDDLDPKQQSYRIGNLVDIPIGCFLKSQGR